jgi:hypothetical protein
MKQTAVEWYFTELWTSPKDKFIWHSILEKAKAMEKEQMKEFYQDGFFIPFPSDATFEQIYKEKYETDSNTESHCDGEK